jgi:hypothetical protein
MKLDQIGFWSEIKLEIMKKTSMLFGGQKQEIGIVEGKRQSVK